jgi:hypothetical protein
MLLKNDGIEYAANSGRKSDEVMDVLRASSADLKLVRFQMISKVKGNDQTAAE